MSVDKKEDCRVVPVILAGGSGTRLWPLSRGEHPKQFLPLMGEESLLVATCRRVADPSQFDRPIVICNGRHEAILTEQLRDSGINPKAVVFEPLARGTAAAAAIAALLVAKVDPRGTVLLLAADNYLQRPAAFLEGTARGARAAAMGRIVVFGVEPTRPETGFGYIEKGEPVGDAPGVHGVSTFVEKPSRDRAEALVSDGRHLWNSGNFLFGCDTLLSEFERLEPEILAACRAALDRALPEGDALMLDEPSLAAARTDSLDRAIMEHTGRAAVVPIDAGWSDVGTWDAVWRASAKDAKENSLSGNVVANGVKGCYIRSEGRLVAAVGLTDLVVIETADAVLIAHRDCAAETKALVEGLQRLNRPEVEALPKEEVRPGDLRHLEMVPPAPMRHAEKDRELQ
jgi:mannose-1-phosphate guanylyltransferase/mannose-1-phosphate guanylyltransferase/mannose-6-phosphate isomerase